MKIAGFQKTTLVDYPGYVACTLFLFGCNFRCGFCYNPELVLKDTLKGFSEDEILKFLKNRKGKLDAVCITGGEPLMTLDFDFVRKIKELGYKVKIDTNGSFPDRLQKLIDEDLVDYIAMDIKSCPKTYSKVVGVDVNMKDIERSIKMISGFSNYEFRTTVVSRFHDVNLLKDTARWLNSLMGEKPKKIFFQGFKKNEGTIDPSFGDEPNLAEKELEEIKKELKDYYGEIIVRG